MKADDVEVNLDELKRFKRQNAKERLEFIDFWANYIKTHKDEDWSKQQNVVINSQMK